jgi:hypothetical protein
LVNANKSDLSEFRFFSTRERKKKKKKKQEQQECHHAVEVEAVADVAMEHQLATITHVVQIATLPAVPLAADSHEAVEAEAAARRVAWCRKQWRNKRKTNCHK